MESKLLWISVAFACIVACSALKCRECSKRTQENPDKGCEKHQETTCDEAKDGKNEYCLKTIVKETDFTIRICDTQGDCKAQGEGCKEITQGDKILRTQCCCQGDNCNSGSAVTTSLLLLISAMLLPKVFTWLN